MLSRISTASVPGIRLRRTQYAAVKTAQRIENAESFQDARSGAGTSNRRKAKDRPVRSPGRGSKPSLTASSTLNAHEPLYPTVNDVQALRRALIQSPIARMLYARARAGDDMKERDTENVDIDERDACIVHGDVT